MKRLIVLLVVALPIALCTPAPLLAEIPDGAHGGNEHFFFLPDGAHGGNEHFFFLPPLFPEPAPTGCFDGAQTPVVEICEWTGTECVAPPIAVFTADGLGSEAVRVDLEEEHYIVNWHTKGLDRTKTYRIRVLFRIEEGVPIEKELGHADVTIGRGTIPIKFRIEEGFFPIGELTPAERAKISPVLLEQFISQDVIEPVEALVNVVDDQIPLPELMGIEVLTDYRPTLAKAFVRISDPATLASLVQSNNINYVYENRKWYLVVEAWQETIGQNLVQRSGYIGTGTAVAILDDGGKEIGDGGGRLPDRGVIDLSVPAFGGCTAVGTPASCRVVAEENPAWADPHIDNHATYVARRLALTAPGTDIIAYDVASNSVVEGNEFSAAIKWVLDHRDEYNIVAINMSFATDANGPQPAGPYSTEDCPKGDDHDFQRLREAGIMPIAGAGNDGGWQTRNDAFYGISHPACSPYVVSVGGSLNEFSEMWDNSTRGPDLDLLAPAEQHGSGPGTSIAAPTVAGAWAILRAALPDLSLEETLDLLKTTGRPIYDHNGSGLTFPLIQLDRALATLGLPMVVYDNGASTHSGGTAVGHFIAADDFTLRFATNVTGASVDVSDGPDQNRRWDGTVEWWLFDRYASLPGNLIASGTGVNVEQRDIVESPLGSRKFTVDFDFGEEIALPAGETFWLALHMQADYSRVSVFWDHQGSTVAYRSRRGGELIGGVPNFVDGQFAGTSPFDKAFRVRGRITPSSSSLATRGFTVEDKNAVPSASLKSDDRSAGRLPMVFMARVYPNPVVSGSGSSIYFTVTSDMGASDVELSVYDVSGRLVRSLVTGVRNPGAHTLTWDLRGQDGRQVSSGVYFYRLRAGGKHVTMKQLVLRQ
jgi:hypothetical protein